MDKERKTKKGNREEEQDDEGLVTTDLPVKKNQKGKRAKADDSWDGDVKESHATDKNSKDAGKKKKDKKKGKGQVFSDDEESSSIRKVSSDEEETKKARKQPKKKKDKKPKDDDDDEFEDIIANQMKSKNQEAKPKAKKPQMKSIFELLNDEGMDIDMGSDDDEPTKESEDETPIEVTEVEKKKKGKEKKKKNKEEDEEIAKMLAEIEMTDSKKGKSKQKEKREDIEEMGLTVVTEIPEEDDKKAKKKKKKKIEDDDELKDLIEEKEAEVVTEIPEDEEEDKKKKKKKKKKDEDEADKEVEGDEEDGGTMKSAAQKKKEKKERERQKKMDQKAKERTKKKDSQEKVDIDAKPSVEESIADMKEDTPALEDEEDEGDKKKKDKSKKKKDEKEEKDKKRPGKKQILAMQEALKKLKEEEERARLEEEAKQRAAEEAEQLRLEKIRLEQERKERKKQKDKEKRERLKAEGKLLTQAQKQQRARAQAMLEALRAQGLDVPKIGEKKERTPRPGDRIRPKKGKNSSSNEEESKTDLTAKSELSTESLEVTDDKTCTIDEPVLETPEEEVKASWEQESDEDVKDAWDASSSEEEEEETKKVPAKKSEVKKAATKKKGGSAESSSEESDSESDESGNESDDSSSEESSDEEEDEQKTTSEKLRQRAILRIQKRREENEKNRSLTKLRSPVVCVLGHVDTGKTKILDKIRHTHVQDSEAGGITQQIGATMVPMDAIREQSKMAKSFQNFEPKIPGLLIIDTPGHESFSNLRSRGSSLCDIAILVVDIMHGLEPQTIESINLLKQKKTPFVVALNKIDRLYEWKPNKHKDVQDTLKGQNRNTQLEFEERVKSTVIQFAEQSLNVKLFYENPDSRTFISLVPTSAHTGDGMGNLMALIVELTQTMMAKQISFSEELQATVLEVKAVPGLGTTVDVILVNGKLREGDTIILAGTDGPLVTQIRSLLMPQALKELRVKNPYQEFREVEAAQGIKVTGKDLEKAIAGLNLLVAHHPDEVEICKEDVAKELQAAMSSIKLAERGVYVQASTLGSLEALIEFLRASKIPYSGVRIGPVVKKDVMKASIMLEHDSQYAVILAFDVKIERDAQELADSLGVKIFAADIIYHLFDKFMAYREELKQKKRDQFKHIAVFPCKLRILPQFIFNTRDPIVVGVSVEAGVVKEGTPLCVPSRDFLDIGIVSTIELNHKTLESARKGQEVCIKIEPHSGETPKLYGRHFEHTDPIVSKITRQSIDACKEYFREDLQKADWQLMLELKKVFQIV